MRRFRRIVVVLSVLLSCPVVGAAQSATGASPQPHAAPTAPRLIRLSGTLRPADGRPLAQVETITLRIYADESADTVLWEETQDVTPDTAGRYAVLLGATRTDGVPLEVFQSGEARWVGTTLEGPGETEGARSRLVSVPYALQAANAETLGGLPASAYLRAGTDSATGAAASSADAPTAILPGTPGMLAKYSTAEDLVSSSVFDNSAGRIGINTGVPRDALHVQFTNTDGGLTGLAVQNLGNTATSYSGMLFYDQNGALGQFQGFNNSTHEYRINNVARVAPGGAFNGSINFMTGSTSRFFVASNGNVGIGTTSPAALLEVSNALSGVPSNVWTTSYTNFLGPYYLARRARGTAAAPTAVQNGDGLSGLYGMGYGTTQFGPASTGGITIQAAQNFTDTQQGTAITFSTTAINSTTPTTRMTLDATGNLGIGTTTVPAAGLLEVSNAANSNTTGVAVATTFANAGTSLFIGRRARGTAVAPTAVLNGDNLVGYLAQGYGTSAFSGTRGGMFVQAAENWTNTAQGTRLQFNTTAAGTTGPSTKMTIDSFGNLGIGTTAPSEAVEVLRQGPQGASFLATTYGAEETNGGGAFFIRNARGTAAAPTAVQIADTLGYFAATGYGTSGFGEIGGGMLVVAAENWTDAAQGAIVAFVTNPLGATEAVGRMAIMPDGNVGIGTFNSIPTIADKLQVFGDIRVGTSGTDGCVKRFDGNAIAGTCASDARFKKNVTPFGPVLGAVAALRPVHYDWRTSEFPDRHFSANRSYGLIAQDVEQVLPELVVTNPDGYKAVDYTKLPLLAIQAVKELKAENEALKAGNEALAARVAELERIVTGIIGSRR